MNKYLLPLKREIWEHYGSFIKMPVILVSALCALLLITSIGFGSKISDSVNSHYGFNFEFGSKSKDTRVFEFNDRVIGEANNISDNQSSRDQIEVRDGLAVAMHTPYMLIHGIMLMVAFSFLLSCLMSDRKDNSILFWKSMPVSETQNVVTKLFAAIVLIPIIAWIASFFMSFIMLVSGLIFSVFSGIDHLSATILQESAVLKTGWEYIGTFLAISLWLLPVAAWFIFASAAAKKNPFLTAVIPVLVIAIGERYVLGSHRFAEIAFQHMSGIIPNGGQSFMLVHPGWHQLWAVLSSSEFWISLPITGALVYGAIWCRENRYENEG